MNFEDLRQANQDRKDLWGGSEKIDASFQGNELAGETGELCNVIKKLERIRLGIAGSSEAQTAKLQAQLREELGDVVICSDLIAATFDIDLGEAARLKFNKVSRKVGIDVIIP